MTDPAPLAIRAACAILGHGPREARRQIVRHLGGEGVSPGIAPHVAHLLREYEAADDIDRAAMREEWRDRWELMIGEAMPEA